VSSASVLLLSCQLYLKSFAAVLRIMKSPLQTANIKHFYVKSVTGLA
jgi:hypothetical protein